MSEASDHFKRVAVFIDVDNLVIEAEKSNIAVRLAPIIDRIREEGQIILVRAYGDWSQPNISPYLHEFRRNTIEMTQLSTSNGKNTADIHLAVEALEMTLLPSAPDMIVIFSGDRDFVPLVQKIKRYGKQVMGIGIKGSTSGDLVNACGIFLYLDEILQMNVSMVDKAQTAGPETDSPAGSVEPAAGDTGAPDGIDVNHKLRRAFSLLSRAVSVLARQGLPTLGSSVRLRMQQLRSTFNPERFGFPSFKEFALAAERAGYVRVMVPAEGDIVFDANFAPDASIVSQYMEEEIYENPLSRLNFDTTEDAVKSYCTVLMDYKHLVIVPWERRRALIEHIWGRLDKAGVGGISLQDLLDDLYLFTMDPRYWVEQKSALQLIRTLCIARCFIRAGKDDDFVDYCDLSQIVSAGVPLEEAIDLVNYTYINGMRISMPDIPLHTDAIAKLLFGEITDDTKREAESIIGRIDGGASGGVNSMAEAFRRANIDSEDLENTGMSNN